MNLVYSDSLAFEVESGRRNCNTTLMYNVGRVIHFYKEHSMHYIVIKLPKRIFITRT